MVGEGAEICSERFSFKRVQGRREDARELDEELLVVARDLGPLMGLRRREGRGLLLRRAGATVLRAACRTKLYK